MILQALYEYYQRRDDLAPQGFERKEIPFIIIINEQGDFINLEDTREGEGKNKRARPYLVIKTKSRPGAKASEITNVFWDHYGYVLGHPKDDSEKAKKDATNQHQTFIKQIEEACLKFPDNKEFIAVSQFVINEEAISKVFIHENWKDCSKIAGCNLSFRIAGEVNIVAEHADLKCFAEEVPSVDEDGEIIEGKNGICLVTGKNSPIAVLHTATSLPGKSGGKLVSFQKNSGYDSYYKIQGENAPVSKEAEAAYTTALNVLLKKDSNNKFQMSDFSVVFWSAKLTQLEYSFPSFFNVAPKDDPDKNIREVKALLESVHSGKLNQEGDTLFYVLGLAPNKARISVRFWKTGKVKDFAEKIAQHFEDLDIVHGKNDEREFFSLFNLLVNIALEFKLENIPPNLASRVLESVLDGSKYPDTLQQQCIRRIRAEHKVTRIRAAILKAYINRKERIYNSNEKQITMALDLENKNQGYLCGRLFAVLEKIQEEAQPGINATIKDRYYGAASSTPVTVFSRLLGLSNHHLVKLNVGRKTFFEKLKQEIVWDINGNGMPSHLSLDDQSRFAIGYYHQRLVLFPKKENIN